MNEEQAAEMKEGVREEPWVQCEVQERMGMGWCVVRALRIGRGLGTSGERPLRDGKDDWGRKAVAI